MEQIEKTRVKLCQVHQHARLVDAIFANRRAVLSAATYGLVLTLTLVVSCAGSDQDNAGTGSTGGRAEGNPGLTGHCLDDSRYCDFPTGGAVVANANAGSDAADGDASVGQSPDAGPPSCGSKLPAQLMPGGFVLVESDSNAIADGGVPAEYDLGDSGCAVDDASVPNTECTGLAHVEQTDAGPVLTLADGSALKWQAGSMEPGVLATMDRVYVHYLDSNIEICPYCGTRSMWSLTISDPSQVDRVLLQNARSNWTLTLDDVSSMLGEPIRAEILCANEYTDGVCYDAVVVTYYDYVVETPVEQSAVDGLVSDVSTDAGDFAVFIAQRALSGVGELKCADFYLPYEGVTQVVRR